ncbi:hypothetical protein ABZ801_18960 [Actinomadura sp. NPDC047616]|uniref:hypothetical protein n=1 Tax=Actinomadura sp. NPDC047616 TaxID=3155914 RepID=UPI00340C7199
MLVLPTPPFADATAMTRPAAGAAVAAGGRTGAAGGPGQPFEEAGEGAAPVFGSDTGAESGSRPE